jgi:hypothetical protein
MTACSGSSEEPGATIDVSEPTAAVRQASEAMSNLSSYHMELTLSPEGTDIRIPIDYERGKYLEKITDPNSGESTELITAGGLFTRTCQTSDHCEEWVLQPSNGPGPGLIPMTTPSRYWAPTLGGATTFFPETLAFSAVDLATGWRIKDGSSGLIVGQVDLVAAINENWSRIGIPTDTVTPSSSPTEIPLSTVELQLSGEGPHFQTVTVYVPGDPNDRYLVVDFSRFNDVSVEAPSDYTTAPY